MRLPHPLVPIVLASTLATGCLAVAAAVGAVAAIGVIKYTENGAQEDFDASVEATFDAAVEALAHFGHDVDADQHVGPDGGHIDAEGASVRLERLHGEDGDFTRATVKVGTFDTDEHRDAASQILSRMRASLGG